MIIVTGRSNQLAPFFDECKLKATARYEYDVPVGQPRIYVCRQSKIFAAEIWPSLKFYR
jgi:hypothetical protein